jgi:hypothetical protein
MARESRLRIWVRHITLSIGPSIAYERQPFVSGNWASQELDASRRIYQSKQRATDRW